jgi:hypothetical protein
MRQHPQLLTLALAALLSFAVGCGKTKTNEKKTGDSGKGRETKKLGKPAKELLVGTWVAEPELDDAKIEDMLKKQGTKKEDMKKAVSGVKSMVGSPKVSVKVNADGTSEVTDSSGKGKPHITKSTWEVTSEEGMVVKLKTVEKRKQGEETHHLTLTFRNDDEYEFETDDEAMKKAPFKLPIVFKRQK